MYELLAKLADPIGIIGVSLIIIAFFLLTSGKWTARYLPYQVLNCLGSIGLLFSLYFHWNLSAVIINTAWLLIGLLAIWRIVKQ